MEETTVSCEMSQKIVDAKALRDFLEEWGISEGDAKMAALAVIFKLGCSPFPDKYVKQMEDYLDRMAIRQARLTCK